MVQWIKRRERGIFAALSLYVAAFAIFQIIRPEPLSEVIGSSTAGEYPKLNYPLYVYYSGDSFNVRTSKDMRPRANNIGGTLERGRLFFVPNDSKGLQRIKFENYPSDNITEYTFKRIQLFEGGKLSPRFALLNRASYIGNQLTEEESGLLARSSEFTEWINWELRQNDWDGRTTYKKGAFSYTKGGYYGTIVSQRVTLYDRKGERIGTLEKGTRIFATMNLPFAVGKNRNELVRIVGYTGSGSADYIEKVGTFFIDGWIRGKQSFKTK